MMSPMLSSDLPQQFDVLALRFGMAALYVFGSRADEIADRERRGTSPLRQRDADVDVGVQPLAGRRFDARARAELSAVLEDRWDAGRVDLVVLPEAGPFLAVEVVRGELLYCADPDAQAEEELCVLRRAADLAPYARERWARVLAGTAA